MKNYVLLLLFLSLGFTLYAQRVKHANQLFEEMNYIEAAQVYDDYLAKNDEREIETLKKAGDAHYLISEIPEALKWYTELYSIQGEAMENDYMFKYIQSLRGVRDYKKADGLAEVYLKRKNNPMLIARFMEQKKELWGMQEGNSGYILYNLSTNSENSDFGPAFYGDQLVYSSSKKNNETGNKIYVWNQQPFLDLYIADRTKNNGELVNEKLFMEGLASRYHDATIAFSKDLDTIYYTSNMSKNNKLFNNADGINNFHVMRGLIKEGEVSDVEDLIFNSKDYSVGHPALSGDGKYLFFVSDMPGGFGDTDIYMVQLNPDGSMTQPKNLGPEINTEGREMFPYYQDDVLYFSSDGHYGLGGLDIFQAKNLGDFRFSVPQNLGKPINSSKDDFSYIIAENQEDGYMSSNRSMGKGDDDIYYFTRSCYQFVAGKVLDSFTKKPLKNAAIIIKDQFDAKIKTVTTDSQGKYVAQVPCNDEFLFTAEKNNYSKASKLITTENVHRDTISGVNFLLSAYQDLVETDGDEEKIKIDPIFFEFNQYDIRPKAAKQLDHIVYVMQSFPEMKIKIESHTDSRGSDTYNLILSQNRAKSTKEYLISQGIAENRIVSIKGYGEIEILNRCSNNVECSDEEHEENRRSDFIVVER
ncbi:OmpA family protein [Zunongwangia sp. SCSIO 43204]|uniref:OmpA family protein n=1 Tax=Zunongwangia sp. SCSIO 43204 TaxID=2779359 RepID=UPI001CAA236F|nr:OmpA family protein [Zunongwangia sp. SCSIO 43204]UAB84107.1 OmpA family protein [Zunongwangia sp. SCSIO 43204]